MAFSPDGGLLVTLGKLPEGAKGGGSLALWSTGADADLIAAVQLPAAVAALAWRAGTEVPTFHTVGSQGLTEWRLEPDALSSTAVHLPPQLRGASLTAVACSSVAAEGARCHGSSWLHGEGQGAELFLGDCGGRVWRLHVDEEQDCHDPLLLAELQGQAITCIQAAGRLCVCGTSGGSLLALTREGEADAAHGWRMGRCEQLDGPLLSLQLHPDGAHWMAATACGTLWHAGLTAQSSVVLCGQQGAMNSWQVAHAGACRGGPPTAAVASAAGVAIWKLVSAGGSCLALTGPPLPCTALHGATRRRPACPPAG
jgi:hypothetical protein